MSGWCESAMSYKAIECTGVSMDLMLSTQTKNEVAGSGLTSTSPTSRRKNVVRERTWVQLEERKNFNYLFNNNY